MSDSTTALAPLYVPLSFGKCLHRANVHQVLSPFSSMQYAAAMIFKCLLNIVRGAWSNNQEQDAFDRSRGPLHLKIANLLSTEIFEDISLYVNTLNPMQAIRLMLLGFFPLSRDKPTLAQRRYTTTGSAKLRGARHWGVFVLDTQHTDITGERLSAQLEQWRYLSFRSGGDQGSLRPLILRFHNFDFSSGEHLASIGLPREDLMAACICFEVRTTTSVRRNLSTSNATGNDWPSTPSPVRRRRRLMDLPNSDYRASLKNSPLRWLCLDTPHLLRVYIDASRAQMYVDGSCSGPYLANTFLPFAPKLRFLDVKGTLSAKLFHISRFSALEHFGCDAPLDVDVLQTISDSGQRLRFLRAGLAPRPDFEGDVYFPSLETLVAADNRILSAVGGVDCSPILSTIWVGDNHIEEAVAVKTFGRASICEIGPWTIRPGELSRGIIDALEANNKTNGCKQSGVTLLLQDMHSAGLWSFTEGWTEEGRWPIVATIMVRNCRLTATAALAVCDLAKVVVRSGGMLIFSDCRAHYSDDWYTPINDKWEDAVLCEGHKLLALCNVSVKIM